MLVLEFASCKKHSYITLLLIFEIYRGLYIDTEKKIDASCHGDSIDRHEHLSSAINILT